MRKFKHTVRASALALMTLGLMGQAVFAAAQEPEATSRQFSAKAGEIVLEAQSFITEDNFSAALQKLNTAKNLPNLSPYEFAVIAQMQGASYYQLGQYSQAITALESAIGAGGLPAKDVDILRVKLAQMMIGNGQYVKGAEALERHLKNGGLEKADYVKMLSQAWVQAKRYDRALPWAEKEFAGANPKTRSHYDTLIFLYSNLKMADRQSDVVKEMIARWPNEKPLWDAWASLLAQSGRDEDAFEVSKLLYLGGALTDEADILKVVQYYAYYDMPFQAAKILESEMNAGRVVRQTERLEQLSSLFRQAREYARAIPILEEATKSSNSAEIDAQLGEALYNEGQCDRAETAFRQAINRGYDAGKAWTLIATCRYEDVQKHQKLNCAMSKAEMDIAPKTKARQLTLAAFEKVPPTSSQIRDAKKWITFIKAERESLDKRCEFEEKVRRDECFKDIRRAYDGQFVDGKFTLGNSICTAYIDDYNEEYPRAPVDG